MTEQRKMKTIEHAKMMIHQLANQLTVIMGNLDLAVLQPEKSPELLAKAQRASREAVTDLRRLSHILSTVDISTIKAEATDAISHAVAVKAASDAIAIKAAADELARKSREVKRQLENPWVDPHKLKKKK